LAERTSLTAVSARRHHRDGGTRRGLRPRNRRLAACAADRGCGPRL